MTMQKQIRAHYQAQSLRPEKLERIVALAAPRWERWVLPTVVAAIVLIAVSLAASTGDDVARDTASNTASAIGQEIASNHRRALDPEFRVTTFAELPARMDRLDFALREPARLAGRGLRMVGARYCSVQGRIAAQIRMEDEQGRGHSLYIVRAFGRVRDGTASHGGIHVELWREGDLLIGLAGAPR